MVAERLGAENNHGPSHLIKLQSCPSHDDDGDDDDGGDDDDEDDDDDDSTLAAIFLK